MALNKTKGNMYPWVTHTWNPIRGRCPHQCTYCYVPHSRANHLYEGKPYLVESFFEKGLGKGKTMFIGSCFDILANEIPSQWIERIFNHCAQFQNKYLFQTKNPDRFYQFRKIGLPSNAIYGTTIETTEVRLSLGLSRAPDVYARYLDFVELNLPAKMVSIEPIIDFELKTMVRWMQTIQPQFISIGADSKDHNLPEPPREKIKELIIELEKFTEVKLKPNLSRLLTAKSGIKAHELSLTT